MEIFENIKKYINNNKKGLNIEKIIDEYISSIEKTLNSLIEKNVEDILKNYNDSINLCKNYFVDDLKIYILKNMKIRLLNHYKYYISKELNIKHINNILLNFEKYSKYNCRKDIRFFINEYNNTLFKIKIRDFKIEKNDIWSRLSEPKSINKEIPLHEKFKYNQQIDELTFYQTNSNDKMNYHLFLLYLQKELKTLSNDLDGCLNLIGRANNK